MTPREAMVEGRKILEPAFTPHGFTFATGAWGQSSGGDFTSAEFVNGNRRLELHFREALGLVTYHIGSISLSHEAYMEALLGRRGLSQHPGFSDDPWAASATSATTSNPIVPTFFVAQATSFRPVLHMHLNVGNEVASYGCLGHVLLNRFARLCHDLRAAIDGGSP